MPDIGYYTLPVIVSMEGVDKQVNSKLGKAFEGIGGKAGKAVSTGIATGTKSAEADLKKLGDAYGKMKDKAEDALGKVRKDEAALQDLRDKGITSGARFVAAEERLNTSRRNSVRISGEAKRAHADLADGQKKLADSSDKAGSKMAAMSNLAGKAGTALTAAGVVAAGAATVGIAALAAGIVIAGKALYDLGEQFDEISDNFVIKLGVTGDKLKELNSQITDLGPTIALSLGEIANISVDVNRHLDGSKVEIEQVTKAVADLNRMTGTQTNIKKFGQLLTQWNIPAKDQVKTLDMLFNVSRRTGQPVNDLMETLTGKGATALRELNIPLEQAIALFVKFQEGGLDAAGSVEALAKLQKYAAGESISMTDALTRTYNAIRAGDSQAGFKAFGKSAGPLIEAVQEGRLSLKDFYSALEEGGPTISETATLTDDFAQKWQKLKNRLEIALKPVATALFDTINTKLSSIGDWVIKHQDQVMRFIGDIGVGLIEAGQSAIDFGIGALNAIKGIIQAVNKLPDWLGGEGDIDTSFIDETVTKLGGIRDTLGQAGDWWRGYTDRAADAVKFTQELGDDISASIDDETHEIRLTAMPSDEQTKALLAEGIQVKEIDGHFTVTSTTPEGQKLLDAFRGQSEGLPVTVKPNLGPAAKTALQQDLDAMAPWVVGVKPEPVTPPGARPGKPEDSLFGPHQPGKAGGGGIYGAGGPTQDNIPIWASSGEHMLSAKDVGAMGGQAGVYAFRKALHMARGGATTATVALAGEGGTDTPAGIGIGVTGESVLDMLAAIGVAISELPGGMIPIEADTKPADDAIKDWRDRQEADPLSLDMTLPTSSLPLPASGPHPGDVPGGGSANPDKLAPNAAAVMAEVHKKFPQMDIWGWGPNPDHNNAHCLDLMTLDNPAGLALGDKLVAHYLKDPRLEFAIWKQQYWYPGKPPTPYGDHGNRNDNHFTHPHLQFLARGGGLPGFGGGDKVPALLEAGEHVLTKDDVAAMGGHAGVYAMRNALHFQGGGQVDPFDPNLTWEQVWRSDLNKPDKHALWKKHTEWMLATGKWQQPKDETSFALNPLGWIFGKLFQGGGQVDPFDPDLTWKQVMASDLSKPERNELWRKHTEWMLATGKWQQPKDETSFALNPLGWIFGKLFGAGGAAIGFAGGGGVYPPGMVPDWDAIAQKESGGLWFRPDGDATSTGGLQIQTPTWLGFGGGAYAPEAWQATKEEQIAVAERILAGQGPEAWAGGKNFVWKAASTSTTSSAAGGAAPSYTRGTGPGGEAGYFKPADAAEQQSLRDDIADLRGKKRQAEAELAELKSDATAAQRIAAEEEVAALDRQIATKTTELGEAQRGEFVAGEPPATTSHYEPYSPSEVQAAEDKAADEAGKLRQAEAELAGLKSDASAAERIAAEEKVAEAKRRKAAADAEVADKRKGKLVESEGGAGGEFKYDPMLDQVGALPGQIVNGLLGDLGIGDIFPDLTQTPLWKSFAGGLSAFKGPLQGLVEGKLGVQQPGWQPGQPVAAMAEGSGDSPYALGGSGFTLGGAFGLPDIEIPPAPGAPGSHGEAGGAPPGPGGQPVSVDASIHYPEGTVIGVDPVKQGEADTRRQNAALAASLAPLVPGFN